MRRRACVFWGSRAYLTVRFPLSAFGLVPPLEVEIPGMKPTGWRGHWQTTDGAESVHIGRLMCSADPRTTERRDWETVYFLERTRWGYEWWEGSVARKVGDTFVREPLSEDIVRVHRTRVLWEESLDKIDHPVADAFMRATWPCKTHYWNVRGDDLYLTYAVTWLYPDRKLRFAAALSRAMKAAKRDGIDARVVRA